MIAGNWKMHRTPQESAVLASKLREKIGSRTEIDIVICPAFLSIGAVYEQIKDSQVRLGAQNLHWENEGAYTGEVSAPMLKEAGCKYVIVGHSERRIHFKEDNQTVNLKAKSCIKWNLVPIICVGEKLEEREGGKTADVINEQVEGSLKDIKEEDLLRTVIAYEPVWAIGTGKTASPEQADEVHLLIRQIVEKGYSRKIASGIRILYGGSVKPDNIAGLIKQEHVDGALVGGASLDAGSFIEIVSECGTEKNRG